MIRHLLCVSLAGAALLLTGSAFAQEQTKETALERQLNRLDFSINGVGEFTNQVQGTNFNGTVATQTPSTVSAKPSNTVGALVTLRYTKSKWVGLEGNINYVRYTEAFASPAFSTFVSPETPQTNAVEYSFGWLVHPGAILGAPSFVSVGSGSMEFTPTAGGGLGLPKQARQVYYGAAGVDIPLFGSNFGVRAQYRMQYYLVPDFGQNYLRIKQRAFTNEPGFGFYVHF